MKFIYDDGGRSKYFKPSGCDCVVRAITIATGRDYKEVYDEAFRFLGYSPRDGVKTKHVRKLVEHFGGEWNTLMTIGTGCKHHLKDGEIPMQGTIICNVSKHLVSVVNGVIHDFTDCSRGGTRCVYGYWRF